MIFGIFTLIVALIISSIAAFYSIAGLTAIFSTAVVPIIIMGAALEIGKITAAVWLKLNWHRAKFTYKLYLVPAVAVLMLLTSMGIFGFLSKAHSDQTLVTGNSSAQLALFDEKIKIQRENIDAARRSMTQMDAQVNERLSRGTSEQGVERAAQLRHQQTAERNRLLKDIDTAQKEIQKLSAERAPVAAELRKVESEVGPIKYIAALVYGPNPDADLLEKAVSWMIIVIVAVFDPLALVLILAAQQSIIWHLSNKRTAKIDKSPIEENIQAEKKTSENLESDFDNFEISKHSYLFKPWVHFPSGKPIPGNTFDNEEDNIPQPIKKRSNKKSANKSTIIEYKIVQPIETVAPLVVDKPTVDNEILPTEDKDTFLVNGMKIKKMEGGYYEVNDKKYSKDVFYYMWPAIAKKFDSTLGSLQADNIQQPISNKSNFGTEFTVMPNKGDLFLRVDYKPNKLYKFNGAKWIEVDKNKTDSYSYDDKYIEFLVNKLQSGEYEIDQLTATEQDLVAEKLKKQ